MFCADVFEVLGDPLDLKPDADANMDTCKQKGRATQNGRHSLFYAKETHGLCLVKNGGADMTACCWQRWKPQDSRTRLLQKGSELFVLISILHTCESVENPDILSISSLSNWTMSRFTKKHSCHHWAQYWDSNSMKVEMCVCVCVGVMGHGGGLKERKIIVHKFF